MVWIVDKKIVRHIVNHDEKLVELPVRVTFEYELNDGKLVDESLKTKLIYNQQSLSRLFPNMDLEKLRAEVCDIVERELHEHIAFTVHKMKIDTGDQN